MLRVRWTGKRAHVIVLKQTHETIRNELNNIKDGKWNMSGHVLWHGKGLPYFIIKNWGHKSVKMITTIADMVFGSNFWYPKVLALGARIVADIWFDDTSPERSPSTLAIKTVVCLTVLLLLLLSNYARTMCGRRGDPRRWWGRSILHGPLWMDIGLRS